MNKILIGMATIFVMFSIWAINDVRASVFDIIKGHASDISSRFADDQFIDGKVVARGNFRDDDRGQDFLHRGSGDVQIVSTADGVYVQLGEEFTTTPGPDYHVYVSYSRAIQDDISFGNATQIELGKLTKGSGASFYKTGLSNALNIRSVTIWCKQFGVFIASADIL